MSHKENDKWFEDIDRQMKDVQDAKEAWETAVKESTQAREWEEKTFFKYIDENKRLRELKEKDL